MSKTIALQDRQEREIIRFLHASSEYREKGRRGEPCAAFPGLTAHSTSRDIQRSVAEAYAEVLAMTAEKHPESLMDDDQLVREIVQGIFDMYASEYVAGLQEAAQGREGAS